MGREEVRGGCEGRLVREYERLHKVEAGVGLEGRGEGEAKGVAGDEEDQAIKRDSARKK